MNTTNLFLENYYDFHTTNYYQLLTLNNIPNGPLKNYIKEISIKNVSTKINMANTNYCSYVINKNILNNSSSNINNFINNKLNYCTIENLTEIYDFLINNNYIINNSELTNIIKSFSSVTSSLENQFTIINNKKLLLCFNYNN